MSGISKTILPHSYTTNPYFITYTFWGSFFLRKFAFFAAIEKK